LPDCRIEGIAGLKLIDCRIAGIIDGLLIAELAGAEKRRFGAAIRPSNLAISICQSVRQFSPRQSGNPAGRQSGRQSGINTPSGGNPSIPHRRRRQSGNPSIRHLLRQSHNRSIQFGNALD